MDFDSILGAWAQHMIPWAERFEHFSETVSCGIRV